MRRYLRSIFGSQPVNDGHGLWAQFDRTFAEADKLFDMASTISSPPHGCICPVGAEKTCQGPLCPRRPIGPATAKATA